MTEEEIKESYKTKIIDAKTLVSKDMTNFHIVVRKLYCPDCGAELIAETPALYNPFTFEPVIRYKCKECGKIIPCNGKSPQLIIVDDETGEETPIM